MSKKEKKVFGIGVNDSPDPVYRYEKVNGKWKRVWICPYYSTWKNMLHRCRSANLKTVRPTYTNCSFHDEWVYFMTFKHWMSQQDWIGKHLDKDILVEGNKLYSPETCRFVDKDLNMFLTDSLASRGKWPLGVGWKEANKKFQANCQNPFTKKQEYLGLFDCPHEAHKAWRKRKHELACQWADIQTDPLIAKALRERFLNKN